MDGSAFGKKKWIAFAHIKQGTGVFSKTTSIHFRLFVLADVMINQLFAIFSVDNFGQNFL